MEPTLTRRSADERGQVLSSLVAVVAVVAVVVGLLVLFGTRDAGDDTTGKPPSPAPSAAETPLPTTAPVTTASTPTSARTGTTRPTVGVTKPVDRPSIEVFNNTPRRGLADRVATKATSAGWTVAGVDNWRGKVVASTVYYPDGMKDAAQLLATDLGIGRTKDALDNMKTDRLSVILTADYSG